MTRVIMAEGCREIDGVTGRRYYAGHGSARGYAKGGSFDMHPADARALVKAGGAIVSQAGATARGIGYRCAACGFGSFLRRCGRCGAECERE